MPILAVAVAVVADTAVAVGAVTSTLGIIAAVGATVSAIGAVTKNQSLEIAGGVLGVVGGVGALAQSAGLFGSSGAASIFGDSASTAAGDIAASDAASSTVPDLVGQFDAATAGAGQVAAAGAGAAPMPSVVDTLGGVSQSLTSTTAPIDQAIGAATGQAGDITANPVTGLTEAQSTPTPTVATNAPSATGTGAGTAVPGVPNPAGPATPAAPSVGDTLSGGLDVTNAKITTPIPDPTGSASGLWNFLKSPGGGMAGYGALQAGGSFLQGAFSTLTPAQVNALNAQAAANQAGANLSAQQLSNMQQPIPVASRAVKPNVTGVPAGIINTAPPANTITGQPS